MAKEGKGTKKKKMLLSEWGTTIKTTKSKKYKGFLNLYWEIEIIKYDTMRENRNLIC